MNQENRQNKTIVKNTMYLYIRTFLTMVLSIYTSRVVLQVLGVEDYGLYNVVGGIAASFSFLSSMLSNATQRYLNYAIGSHDYEGANQVFSMNVIIYLIYAVFSVVAIEIVGDWFVKHKMVVPADRLDAVYWTLHATTIVMFVSLISSVYESVLIARENMKVYAYTGMFDAVMKFIIAYIIGILPFDKLKSYAVLLAIMAICSRMIPVVYTMCHYSETKLKYFWDREHFKSMFGFIGWNFLGTVTFILNDQGMNMLLNTFFGAVVNAARGLSMQVKSAISSFSMGFFTAIRPQIVKSYAEGNLERFIQLIFNSSKYTFFLLWVVSLPVILRADELLVFWLKDVPEWTGQFVVWVCIFNLINSSFCDPVWQGIQAIGEIKKYVLIGSLVYLTAFPCSWIALRYGASPLAAFQILVVVRIVYAIVSIAIFKTYVTISVKQYALDVLYPIVKVVFISLFVACFINGMLPEGFLWTFVSCILIAIIVAGSVFALGIGPNERSLLINYIRIKLCKKS